jgi:hypothetical protein
MFPPPLEILMAFLLPLARRLARPVLDRIDELEYSLMARADDLVSRLNTATNDLASDFRDIRSQLQALRDQMDDQVAEQVDDVLDRFEPGIVALEALGADQGNPVPDPGTAPAGGTTEPADGGTDQTDVPVGESPNPDTSPVDSAEIDSTERTGDEDDPTS